MACAPVAWQGRPQDCAARPAHEWSRPETVRPMTPPAQIGEPRGHLDSDLSRTARGPARLTAAFDDPAKRQRRPADALIAAHRAADTGDQVRQSRMRAGSDRLEQRNLDARNLENRCAGGSNLGRLHSERSAPPAGAPPRQMRPEQRRPARTRSHGRRRALAGGDAPLKAPQPPDRRRLRHFQRSGDRRPHAPSPQDHRRPLA